jgi:hypothetical protein
MRSPATLAGRTLYPTAFQHGVFSARLGDAKSKNPDDKLIGVFVLATSYSRTACRRTTIGAAAFHFRVRNGNGWCHHAIVTRAEKRLRCSALVAALRAARRLVVGGSPNRLGDWGQSPLPEISKELSALPA